MPCSCFGSSEHVHFYFVFVCFDLRIFSYELFLVAFFCPPIYLPPPSSQSQAWGAMRPVPPIPPPSLYFIHRTGVPFSLAIASSPRASAQIDHFDWRVDSHRTRSFHSFVVDLFLKLGWGCKRRWTGGVEQGQYLCKFFSRIVISVF